MQRIRYPWLPAVFAVFTSVVRPALAQSAAQRPPSEPTTTSGADPTEFVTRYEPSFEHKSIDGGVSLDSLTLRSDFALSPKAVVRLDLPITGYRPGADLEAAGFARGLSLGDILLQVDHKPYSSRHMALIYGLRLDLDTGTTAEVSQGGTTYTPVVGAAFYLPKQWLVAPFVRWFLGSNLDNLPEAGTRDDVNRLSIRPQAMWQPLKRNLAYLLFDPECIWDLEAHAFTATLGIEYGKSIGRTELLTLKSSVRLTDGTTNWGIKFGFRPMFPGRYIL